MQRKVRIPISTDDSRIIGSKDHNAYVKKGENLHQPTNVVPSSLLNSLDPQLQNSISVRHKEIENLLREIVGEPYYSREGFILYQGDCALFLEKLSRSQFRADLSITSPPYNIGKEYENPISVEDYVSWCAQWITQIHNIMTLNGTFWLNLGYFEVPNKGMCVPISYLLWDKTPFYLIQEIVWKYGAGVSAKFRLSPRNEKWMFYVKNRNCYSFNLDAIRDPNVKYPNQKKNGKYRCNPLGKNPSDVWEYPKVTTGQDRSSKERTGHPAQFPLGIVERIVKVSSNPTQVVLDPFAGSCSTGIAAAGLGRIFVGFEIRADYCEMAVNRFESFQAERQESQRLLKLF